MRARRLSPKEQEILELLVRSGESYGLAIVDRTSVARGSVYVLLDRMEEKQFVTSRHEERPSHASGNPRRLYRATPFGRRLLTLQQKAEQ